MCRSTIPCAVRCQIWIIFEAAAAEVTSLFCPELKRSFLGDGEELVFGVRSFQQVANSDSFTRYFLFEEMTFHYRQAAA